jgi:hypothetical protein
MNISKNNYEAYLLDYLEGRLSKDEALLLQQFILENPALGNWEELCGELPVLSPSTMVFADKEQLLKQEIKPCKKLNEANYNDFFISFHEGLLSANEQQELEAFLQLNPFLRADFDLYKKVYLKADEELKFIGKQKLLRKAPVFTIGFIRNISVAASLLLLASIVWLWLQPESKVVAPEIVYEAPEIKKTETEEKVHEIDDVKVFQPVANEQTAFKAVNTTNQKIETSVNAPLEILPVLAFKEAKPINNSEKSFELVETRPVTERLLLAAVISGEEMDNQVNDKSAFGRIFDNTIRKTLAALAPNKNDVDSSLQPDIISGGFSFWDLAQAGVKTYNTLTDNEVQLVQATDEQGRISGMRFNSEKINFNRSFDKKLEN